MSKKSSKLVEISEMFDKIEIDFEQLSNGNDTRYKSNVRHKMEDIILITLFGVLANCDEWTEIEIFARKKEKWLRKCLELPNGIPSHDTIQRVISLLDPQSLYSDAINYLINKINQISTEKEGDMYGWKSF